MRTMLSTVIILQSALAAKSDTNNWSYEILPLISHQLEAGTFNGWKPSFYSFPVKEQFRLVHNEVYFGRETNHMAAGLLLLYGPNTNRTDIALFPVFRSGWTNEYGDGNASTFWLVPVGHRYLMMLRDQNDVLVPPSKLGAESEQTFAANVNNIDR